MAVKLLLRALFLVDFEFLAVKFVVELALENLFKVASLGLRGLTIGLNISLVLCGANVVYVCCDCLYCSAGWFLI